jgi:hypothetical protein
VIVEIWNYKANGDVGGGIAFNVTGDHENRVTDKTNLVVEVNGNGVGVNAEPCGGKRNGDLPNLDIVNGNRGGVCTDDSRDTK